MVESFSSWRGNGLTSNNDKPKQPTLHQGTRRAACNLIHEKVLDLEAKLSGVGGDISTIKKNMENLVTKLS